MISSHSKIQDSRFSTWIAKLIIAHYIHYLLTGNHDHDSRPCHFNLFIIPNVDKVEWSDMILT